MYDTSHDLYPDDQPHHTYLNALDSNQAVDEVMAPTPFEIMAYVYAVESYNDHERYGHLPYEGGLMDQPFEWKIATSCVYDALNAARAQARVDAKEKARGAAVR